MRRIIPPHPSRNLDFDVLYRLIGRGFIRLVSVPAAAVDNIWSEVYARAGLRGLLGIGRAANVFDSKVIDGVLDNSARVVRDDASTSVARVQSGRLQDYLAATAALGVLVFLLTWFVK
jgi:multicomponent Na+:H+ antiporter subunit D